MRTTTLNARWLLAALAIIAFTSTSYAQRNVTLTLNTATLADTLNPESVIKVMGAVNEGTGYTAPFTLPDGSIISWDITGDNESNLEATNLGGDYWEISFQVPNEATTQFKFFSQHAEDAGINGWEADPNPSLEPGTSDTTLALHYFEWQGDYKGMNEGDKGPYDWRPYEEKEDTVAVWYRVYMNTEAASASGVGYDRTDDAQVVGLRGDNLGGEGPLDWGATLIELTPESNNPAVPGYHIYSGVAYYPESLAGSAQPYKFFVNPGGWESSPDRTFTVPAQDTTLHWVYYSNSAPLTADPVEAEVLFTVDLTPFEDIGLFDQSRGDTLWVLGSFNNWQDCMPTTPDQCLLQKVPGEDQFETALPLRMLPGQNLTYKYFLDFNDANFISQFGVEPPSGWEEGHATGTDRVTEFTGEPFIDAGISYFNDVHPLNVIPDGTSIDVHFAVDMAPALDNDAQPFNPSGGDSVTIRVADPIWAFTQGVFTGANDEFPLFRDDLVLTDDDGDNVYTGTLTVEGPTYSSITFRYAYGQGSTWVEDAGLGAGATPGRNRTYYIDPNTDSSWPAEYELPVGTFQVAQGPLPYESNPAFAVGVEPVDTEVPSRIALEQNYPNPFNPSTTFEYSISETQHIKLRVFDVLGRAVATLVDGVQPASTYRVSFDATHLASGVYVYQLETPTRTLSRTMILTK